MKPALTSKAKVVRIGIIRPTDSQMDQLEKDLGSEFTSGDKVFFLSLGRAGETYQTVAPNGMPVAATRSRNSAAFIESVGIDASGIDDAVAALA